MQNEKFQIYEPEQMELNQEQLQIQKPMVEWGKYQKEKQIIKVYELEGFYYIKESTAKSLGLARNPINFGGIIFYPISYKTIKELEKMDFEIEYHKIEISKEISRSIELDEYNSSDVLDEIDKNYNYNSYDVLEKIKKNNNYEDFKEDYIEETNRNKTR